MAILELSIQGIEPALSVRRFEIRESISDLFTISIEACSPRPDIDFDDVVLMSASFSMNAGWAFVHGGGNRTYTGICEAIEQVQAEPSGLSTYIVTIVPRLWLLTQGRAYRIFQHLTIPDIVTRILDAFCVVHQWLGACSAKPRSGLTARSAKEHYPFHFGGPGRRMDYEATKAWLFRFDAR